MYHHTMWARGLVLAVVLTGCGDDGGSSDGVDGPALVNGCPSLTEPQANPGDPIDGDTFATSAAPQLQQL